LRRERREGNRNRRKKSNCPFVERSNLGNRGGGSGEEWNENWLEARRKEYHNEQKALTYHSKNFPTKGGLRSWAAE